MRLIIIRFEYKHLGGSASIRIGHGESLSSFDQPSYLGVDTVAGLTWCHGRQTRFAR